MFQLCQVPGWEAPEKGSTPVTASTGDRWHCPGQECLTDGHPRKGPLVLSAHLAGDMYLRECHRTPTLKPRPSSLQERPPRPPSCHERPLFPVHLALFIAATTLTDTTAPGHCRVPPAGRAQVSGTGPSRGPGTLCRRKPLALVHLPEAYPARSGFSLKHGAVGVGDKQPRAPLVFGGRQTSCRGSGALARPSPRVGELWWRGSAGARSAACGGVRPWCCEVAVL